MRAPRVVLRSRHDAVQPMIVEHLPETSEVMFGPIDDLLNGSLDLNLVRSKVDSTQAPNWRSPW